MKKRTKNWIICAVILLLAVVWVWRYMTLNAYYESISLLEEKQRYAIGDIVPYESDRSGSGAILDGYSLRVNSMEMMDYDDYLASVSYPTEDLRTHPDKVALVQVTLFNENSDAEGIMLTELQLHGIDQYFSMDWDLLVKENPILEENYGIRLPYDSECELTLPFSFFQMHFSAGWDDLESYDLYLHLTTWPTEKDIRVQ